MAVLVMAVNLCHLSTLADILPPGFDYVVADITNWPVNTSVTDVAVIRPTEVRWMARQAPSHACYCARSLRRRNGCWF
jgi:hypothetical protein